MLRVGISFQSLVDREPPPALDNLAELHREMADHLKSEPLCRRALAIREKALGSDGRGGRT